VLGRDVVYLPGDSGDGTPDVAGATVEGHLDAGADVIVGAAGDRVSLDVIDRITGAGRIQFSPAANSPAFTTYEDDDLFFRTSPSDDLQGQALADLAVDDGHTTAAIVVRDDAYGSGLLTPIRAAFERHGGEVVLEVPYEPDLAPGPGAAADIEAIAEAVVAADPQALVLVGFEETAAILSGIYERGFTSRSHGIYLSDASIGDPFGAAFTGPGSLAGVKGTVPIAEPLPPFTTYMRSFDPSIGLLDYAAETYDAVVITALASIIAGTDEPAAVARHINGVNRDGERCDAFDDCVELLGTGADVDFIGYSGPQALSQPGEPTIASFSVFEFGPDNRLDRVYHLTHFR
jgi:branched-chain amino acid transport system substrate-binding protein